jgi:general stress protein CsbA
LATIVIVALLTASEVWTYWISFFIIVPVILLCLGIGVAYLVKVVSLKYPRR